MPNHRIVFAGTPSIAAQQLSTLLTGPHTVCGVLSQADKPAGRGRKKASSAVATLARQHNLPLLQPHKVDDATLSQLTALAPDLILVVAYGLLLPPAMLTIPRYGCINIHTSMLPRWRGASPILHAIWSGDRETGITYMKMDEGLDTGPILEQYPCPIQETDTSLTLTEKLSALSSQHLNGMLQRYPAIPLKHQSNAHLCYAGKIKKSDGLIDWSQPAHQVLCQIRAMNPWPMAYTLHQGEPLRVGHACWLDDDNSHPVGQLIEVGTRRLAVQCGEGRVELLELQKPGKKMLPIQDVLNGHQHGLVQGCLLSMTQL